MKKQIPWSTILTTAIPLLVVSTLIALLIITSSGSDIADTDPEIITPIEFTPSVNLADEDVLVAENDGFALWANLATTKITLYQKDKDTYFTSVPEKLEEKGIFADVKRPRDGGKGLEGVVTKDSVYFNPFIELMLEGGKA